MTKKNGGKATGTPPLEGEILGPGVKAPEDRPATAPSPEPAKARANHLPWIATGVLFVFTAGLFVAPWAEDTMRRLTPSWFPTEAVAADPRISDIKTRLGALEAVDVPDPALVDRRLTAVETRIQASESHTQDADSNGDAQFSDLEARIAALEARPIGGGDRAEGEDNDAALIRRLDALALRLSDIEEAASSTTTAEASPPTLDPDQLAQLGDRLQALEARASDFAAAGLPRAVARLGLRIDAGQAFDGELALVRANLADIEVPDALLAANAVATLDGYARTGVDSVGRLRDQFATLVATAADAPEEVVAEGFWAGLGRAFDELVSVRRIDSTEGEGRHARLRRIELSLQSGDVATALDELAGLDEAARVDLVPFEIRARIRLEVDAAQAVLMRLSGISTPAGSGGG